MSNKIITSIKNWFLSLPVYKRWVAVVGPVVILVLAINILPSKPETEAATETNKKVTLSSVGELSSNTTSVSLVGQVTSVSEATIRAEGGGRLTKVYKKLGDPVVAGQVIGEFENSGERASVLQAEGALDSAKAARDIARINTQTAGTNIGDTKQNVINTINSAFTTMDDIVRSKTDSAFIDPRTDYAKIQITFPDSLLQTKIENARVNIEKMLIARAAANASLYPNSDLVVELSKIQSELQVVRAYMDDLNSAYVKAIPNGVYTQASIEAQKAVIGGARTSIAATISTISGAKTTLQNAIAANDIAGRTTGDANVETASSDAQVKTAQGGYLAALSRLEKTIIRSPISGTLNSLTIETGDYVSPQTQVAVVSNNGALEVVTYVSTEEFGRIIVGSKVKVDGSINGVVTKVAPAIDPVTKKIEIRVGITDNAELVNGQAVRVEIVGANKVVTNLNNKNTSKSAMIKIPLSAVKITPRDNFVFTLSASSTLVAVPVTIGTLLGEYVEIKQGLTNEMVIVKDARGLKEGEVVTQ